MAAKKKPAKRPGAKPKRRTKALRAGKSHLRAAATTSEPVILPSGLPMMEAMSRAMAAYAELPGRLLNCTSPVQFWAEYLRFGQRLLTGLQSAAQPPSRSRARSSRKKS